MEKQQISTPTGKLRKQTIEANAEVAGVANKQFNTRLPLLRSDTNTGSRKKARTTTKNALSNDSSTRTPKKSVDITPLPVQQKISKSLEEDGKCKRSKSTSLLIKTTGLSAEVPDLFCYPRNQPGHCQCYQYMTADGSCCLGRCHVVEHFNEYGWEYKALLKRMEDENYKGRMEWFLADSKQPDKVRALLVDWIIDLSKEYKFSPITLHLAITLIDKTLACTPTDKVDDMGDTGYRMTIRKNLVQCVGCACTWIAAKMEETSPMSVDDLVYISADTYEKDQILAMERHVCSVLKFHLQHVTPAHYAYEYLLASQGELCQSSTRTGATFHFMLRYMFYYLLELGRMEYSLMSVKPSLLAAAATFLARASLGIRSDDPEDHEFQHKFWTKTLNCYTGYSVEDLKHTVRELRRCHEKAESSTLKAAFTKYGTSKFMYVSHRVVLREEDLYLD